MGYDRTYCIDQGAPGFFVIECRFLCTGLFGVEVSMCVELQALRAYFRASCTAEFSRLFATGYVYIPPCLFRPSFFSLSVGMLPMTIADASLIPLTLISWRQVLTCTELNPSGFYCTTLRDVKK